MKIPRVKDFKAYESAAIHLLRFIAHPDRRTSSGLLAVPPQHYLRDRLFPDSAKSTVGKLLEYLEFRGWIVRFNNENHVYRLTQEGERING